MESETCPLEGVTKSVALKREFGDVECKEGVNFELDSSGDSITVSQGCSGLFEYCYF